MTRPSLLRQPGLAMEPRIVAIEARGRRIQILLRRGHHLLSELTAGLLAQGFVSGVANFAGLKLGPFAYVRPALSPTGENAAWYSETFRPAGVSVVDGHVDLDASDALRADVSIGLVDLTGALSTGRVVRGINPVSITFELVLESLAT